MALGSITSSKATVTRAVARDAPPNLLREALQLDGDDAFTGATMSEPDGASGWLVYPETCDGGVAFEVQYNIRNLLPGQYSTTLRATSGLVTCNIPISLQVLPGVFNAKTSRGRK